jgi:hypothetical protein
MPELIEPQMGLNFEQVWAALMQMKETQQETDRQMKETDRLFRESKAETDRQMKELQKSMGYLNNRFGELAEHLVLPNIIQKFNALHYHFKQASNNHKLFNPETGQVAAEFDILLENDTSSIGVEVKAKPAEKDLLEHIQRLELLRNYKYEDGDTRAIRGAIAGAIMSESVRRAALGAGLYVIEQTGDTVKIEEPPRLRAW